MPSVVPRHRDRSPPAQGERHIDRAQHTPMTPEQNVPAPTCQSAPTDPIDVMTGQPLTHDRSADSDFENRLQPLFHSNELHQHDGPPSGQMNADAHHRRRRTQPNADPHRQTGTGPPVNQEPGPTGKCQPRTGITLSSMNRHSTRRNVDVETSMSKRRNDGENRLWKRNRHPRKGA